MKTRRYRNYYARRRAPHSLSSFYLRAKLIPLAPKLLSALAVGAASAMGFLPTDIRSRLCMQSDRLGEEVSEQSQSIFFREPGLDVLFVRVLASIAGTAGAIVHAAAAFDAIAGWDRSGKLQRLAQVTPRNGYEALMAGMLIAGTSLGQMTGGAAHADKYFDSQMGPEIIEYPGHPNSQAHRLWAPHSLQDMAADIDDLYWAGTYGQSIKITRVGEGEQRRWLVSIPGTNHFDTPSTPNPADMETNIREALGLSSSMRMGIIRALHQAMSEDGIVPSDYANEPIIIVAHSQGGLIAVNLGSLPPEDVGVKVQGILGLGSPGHRACLRSDVVMVDVAHDQDVVPSTDGAGARIRDQRVMVGRNLTQPRIQPLYYAHSSSTYTETVGRLERRSEVTRWDRVGQAIRALQEMLPRDGEPTRVRLYDIWQELDDPHGSVWARVNVLDTAQSQDTAADGDHNSHGGN